MLKRDSRRISVTIFIAQSFSSAALISALTLIAVVAEELGGDESLAGLPSTVVTFGRAGFAFPLGILLDQWGRRNALSFAYGLGVLGGALGVFAIVQESFFLFLIAAAFIGMMNVGGLQARYVAAEAYPESQRARIIGMIVFAGTIGSVLGPLMVDPSGRLVEQLFNFNEYAGSWLVVIIFNIIAALVIFGFLRPDPLAISRQIAAEEEAERHLTHTPVILSNRPLREIFNDSQVQLAVLSMIVAQTVMQMLMVMSALHMKHHDYGNGSISVVITAHTLGMFGLSPLSGYMIDRLGRINMILMGAVILILSFIIAPLSIALPVLILSLFLLGLGWNLCFVGGSSLLADALSPEERGRSQGFSEALVSFTAAFGTLSSGIIFKYGDFISVAAVGLMLTLMLTGMIGRLNASPSEPLEQPL